MMTVNARAAGVVHALIRLAGTLQLDIVAEGVEHDDQVQRLVELGCDQIQGFCFSQPLPPGGIEALLHQDDEAGIASDIPLTGADGAGIASERSSH